MSAPRPVLRVVLADDHPVVLGGLRSLIETEDDFEVLAACCDGPSALEAIRRFRPDLVVLDIVMPGASGLDVLAALAAEGVPSRVVFLAAAATDQQVLTAVGCGARGIMLKDAAPDTLIECLRVVAAGGRWLPPELVHAAAERQSGRRLEADRLERALTPRERELVLLASEGLPNKEIARRLHLAEGTVKIHLHNVYQKLGVANRTAMAAFALANRDRLARRAAAGEPAPADAGGEGEGATAPFPGPA